MMPPQNANPGAGHNIAARDYLVLALMTAMVSIAALAFYYRHDAILLQGDAVAHINKARLVFDSRTPGLFQLGSVWLPLPHLLDVPFLIHDRLWQTGIGGSIPSMLAYVAGTLGVFRLVRGMASRMSAWAAALIYALNPNLIYMQSTAMTESLYLALLVWAAVYFSEFALQAAGDSRCATRSLERCAILLSAAMLVRYDAWFLAAVMSTAAFAILWRRRTELSAIPRDDPPGAASASPEVFTTGTRYRRMLFSGPYRYSFLKFMMLPALTAALWLAYNYNAYGDPLEFATGPYSARAIQARSLTPTWRSYPGENSPRTAALYFLKVSRLNLGEGRSEYLLFSIAFLALLCVFFFARRFLPWAVLWSPLVFYVLCIAWGSVPVYTPDWWPFSYYNVRYGLQMLPAVAVFSGLAVDFAGKVFPQRRGVAAMSLLLIAAWSYGSAWRRTPITLREAQVNGADRLEFERRLAGELKKLPPSATLLMDCSAYPGGLQAAAIPFQRVLRESNPPQWEIALTQPAQSADYIIAIDHDAVAMSVRLFPGNLHPVVVVRGAGLLQATIYRSAR